MRKADAATPDEWARGQLMVVGLSYHTTSLEKREQLATISQRSERSEQRGTAHKPMPGVLLATCNRIELYSWVTGRRGRSAATLAGGLAEAAGVPLATFESDLFTKSARKPCGISSASSAVWTPLSSATSRSTARYAQHFV